MRIEADDMAYIGLSTLARLQRASARLLATGLFGGKAFVGPYSFQSVQDMLVANRDPTLRAEWDGRECFLRFSICGRALDVYMRPDLPDYAIELVEGTA